MKNSTKLGPAVVLRLMADAIEGQGWRPLAPFATRFGLLEAAYAAIAGPDSRPSGPQEWAEFSAAWLTMTSAWGEADGWEARHIALQTDTATIAWELRALAQGLDDRVLAGVS